VPFLDDVVTDGTILPLASWQETAVNTGLALPAKSPAHSPAQAEIPPQRLTPPATEMPVEQWTASNGVEPTSADEFDPYYKWLGIAPDEQPASHY
jgi:hypothetical protein